MASPLPPIVGPQPNPQSPYAAFNFQPSPTATLADILGGMGMGLMSQGPSMTPISPYAGFAQGMQNAQQLTNQRLQRQGMQAQNVLAGQAYRKGQQDLALGNVTMAQTLMRMNYMRRRVGLPDLTADDLANNPSLATGGAPGAASPSPGTSAASPYVTTSGQPATAGNAQFTPNGAGSYSTNVTPSAPAGGGATQDASDPYGFNGAVNDALMIDPKFGKVELDAAQANPAYQLDLAMTKLGMVKGQDGAWKNVDGSVASQAQVAGAIAAQQQWAGVGPANAKEQFSKSITPITITVPDGRGGFQNVNTSQLAAAGNPTAGLPVVNPTDPAQAAQLSAASAGGAAAGAAPYDFVSVDVPNPAVPGSTIKTLMSKADASAYMGAMKGQGAPAQPSPAPQPQSAAPQSSQDMLVAQSTAPAGAVPPSVPAQPPMQPAAPRVPGIPGQVTLGPADQAMLPDLVKNLNERQLAAQGANDSLVSLGELRKALNGLPTGPGTENANVASAAFQRLGIDINSILPAGVATDPVKYAIALKNINQLGMGLARSNFPGGRITNADLTLALTATPNFFNSPGANKELLGNIEGIQRLKIERADYDRQWLTQHGGQPSLSMEDSWKQHVMGMKNVPDLLKQGFLSFSDQAANPNAAKSPQIDLPPGAVNSGIGSDGQTYYTYKNPNGAGYYTGDKNGKPVH